MCKDLHQSNTRNCCTPCVPVGDAHRHACPTYLFILEKERLYTVFMKNKRCIANMECTVFHFNIYPSKLFFRIFYKLFAKSSRTGKTILSPRPLRFQIRYLRRSSGILNGLLHRSLRCSQRRQQRLRRTEDK